MIKNVNLNSLKGLRVLYVEDDDETREELDVLLKNQVKGLYVANNGLDGLKFYKKHNRILSLQIFKCQG